MRDYVFADQFGRFYLNQLDRDSILLLESDDALSTTRYFQVVKGFRTDVLIVDAARLGSGWYDEHLRKLDARLKPAADARSFAQANVARGRAVYFEAPPLPELPGLAPAGPLMRLAAPGEPNEPQDWPFPVVPAVARRSMGRPRGIRRRGTEVEPEAYEQRWVSAFVRAEDLQARVAFRQGDYRRAVERFESARAADPDRPDPELIHLLGVSHYLLGEFDRAEPLLKQSLRLGPTPRQSVRALSYLSTICRKQGRTSEALRYQEQAMTVVGADPELRREFEQFPRKDR
jgi:tetratricopeptide (TPR) repeat protein